MVFQGSDFRQEAGSGPPERGYTLLFRRRRFGLVPIRRRNVEEMADEEVVPLALPERAAARVVGVRDHDQLEILVRLNQGVDDLHGAGRVDVRVHLAHQEKKLPLQAVGVVDVGGGGV